MSLIALIVAIVLFTAAAFADFGWLGMSSDHIVGLIALGLVAFAVAHLPLPGYWRR